MRIDGTINTYIMYMPDGSEDTVRGLNASLDFSENIGIQNCKEGMDDITDIKIKSIEAKVLNGRKISIKATLEANVRIYSKEEVEIINNMENADNINFKRRPNSKFFSWLRRDQNLCKKR